MQIQLADAFKEACQALGESIIEVRLLKKELARLELKPEPEVTNENNVGLNEPTIDTE